MITAYSSVVKLPPGRYQISTVMKGKRGKARERGFGSNPYNSGSLGAQNVYAQIQIFDNASSQVSIASKRIYIGNLNPGDSKTITTEIQVPYSGDPYYFRVFPIQVY